MPHPKAQKTNAMRLLDRAKASYRVNYYDCDAFIDAIHVADQLHQPYDRTFKTLVTTGKSGAHFVFVVPIAQELDLRKAAKAVNEKYVELLHVKDIRAVTGYVRGGCTPIGMKKQFPTVLHESALQFDEIIISGGCLGAQIFLAPGDLVKVTNAAVADITE
ncbi:MAG: Cys-tRNA(Pro) deacylase [Clostridia bacterium]|nr:Cys-tRNA(Pro) deacylase [Clostridia bacterium]MBR3095672.1 Cys-tRNA(Pro) deacylase [Clostridia bacterium]